MSTELIDQVNQLRLEEDLTYLDLAERIGIDASALYRVLNRQVEPLDRTLFKIRRFLETREAETRESTKRRPKRRVS